MSVKKLAGATAAAKGNRRATVLHTGGRVARNHAQGQQQFDFGWPEPSRPLDCSSLYFPNDFSACGGPIGKRGR